MTRLGSMVALALAVASTVQAQGTRRPSPPPASPPGGFAVGYTDVGPVVGIGNLGGANLSVGGRFERGFRAISDNGVIGIGFGVDWYRYSSVFGGTDFGFTYVPVSATANYHFRLSNKKLDPFVGLGLGYYFVSTPACDACTYNSGIYFVGHAGIRYFVKPNLALYADAGAGAGLLRVGAMFKVAGR